MIAVVLALGALLPALLCRVPRRVRRAAIAGGLACAIAGPVAATRVDTRGRDRNVVTALTATIRPRIDALAADHDWRRSPFESGRGEDLSGLRGAASGSNVVIVVLESTAARYLRAYGAADDPTPNLTTLAERALVFDHAYATYPESIKGMVAAFESRYPAFDVPAEAHVSTAAAPLARVLGAAGYRTALFHSGRFAYLGMDAIVAAQGFDTAEDAGAIGGNVHSSFGVDEPSAVRRMLAWIDGLPPGQRFFATYMPVAGHHPYATPEAGPFHDAGELGAYKNALRYGDESLGDLVSGLAARRLLDHTLLVIFGDHGEAFGQHDGNFGHTLFVYDENVHVPLIVALPRVADGAARPARGERDRHRADGARPAGPAGVTASRGRVAARAATVRWRSSSATTQWGGWDCETAAGRTCSRSSRAARSCSISARTPTSRAIARPSFPIASALIERGCKRGAGRRGRKCSGDRARQQVRLVRQYDRSMERTGAGQHLLGKKLTCVSLLLGPVVPDVPRPVVRQVTV